MATKGATPGSKTKTQNLNKQKTNGQSVPQANATDLECSFADSNIGRGLNEKDVEIDHLKTTLIALNEKVVVSLNGLSSKVNFFLGY